MYSFCPWSLSAAVESRAENVIDMSAEKTITRNFIFSPLKIYQHPVFSTATQKDARQVGIDWFEWPSLQH
jgi:hypothetical protein